MSDNIFIDTNIIVHARVRSDVTKHGQAKSIFIKHEKDNIFISTQVLTETYNALRKNRIDDATRHITIETLISKMNILPVTVDTVKQCFEIKNRYMFSYLNSLLLAAALLGNCSTFYSEDMQHGQIISGKVKIINPFLLDIS